MPLLGSGAQKSQREGAYCAGTKASSGVPRACLLKLRRGIQMHHTHDIFIKQVRTNNYVIPHTAHIISRRSFCIWVLSVQVVFLTSNVPVVSVHMANQMKNFLISEHHPQYEVFLTKEPFVELHSMICVTVI
jgi:hypothetical protein